MRAPSEDQHQIWLAQYLDGRGLLWCHVPNGGWRRKATAGRLRAMGAKPGVPDVLIFVPFRGFAGLAVELKRPGVGARRGRPTKDQLRWHAALREAGWVVEVCYGWTEAKDVIERYYGRIK